MLLLRDWNRRLRSVVAPAIFLSLAAYFIWNSTQGNRGLISYARNQEILKARQAELAAAEALRERWERRVTAMKGQNQNGDNRDGDLLDESVRAQLNLVHPDDIVVPLVDKRQQDKPN